MGTILYTWFVLLGAAVFCGWWFSGGWRCLALAATLALLALPAINVARNVAVGCYPWSPAEVEYHEGMVRCPGQRIIWTIQVAPPEPRA